MRIRATAAAAFLFCASPAGCADHRTVSPPPDVTSADGARWAQYCTYFGALDDVEMNRFLAMQGTRGWELTWRGSDAPATNYCFKMRVEPRAAAGAKP
jgi:hypothetical protein